MGPTVRFMFLNSIPESIQGTPLVNRPHTLSPPGVEVTGAGSMEVNGFYRRREAEEGPPGKTCTRRRDHWVEITEGRPWYQKDDGRYIRWNTFGGGEWIIKGPRRTDQYIDNLYCTFSSATTPPTEWGCDFYYGEDRRRPSE